MANPIKAVKAIGRAVGGITGKGAKSVNPVYKNSNLKIPSNAHPKLHSKVSSSVKLVPSAEMKKTNSLFGPTSGAKQAGKENAQSINTSKRGLKAANKPRGLKYSNTKGKTVKSKNIKLDRDISESNAYMAAVKQYQSKTGRTNDVIYGTDNVLKYTPPARPNRVRGGSMKSKLNFPKGMK